MSEGQSLFLILSLLYLSDCLLWLGRRSLLFASSWLRSWRLSSPAHWFSASDGAIALLNPLPPLGAAFVVSRSPVSLSPSGVSSCSLADLRSADPSRPDPAFLPFDRIADCSVEGKFLLLNRSRFAKFDSPAQAASFAELIDKLRSDPPRRREAHIRAFVDRRFSRDDASVRLDLARSLASRLRESCIVFFLFLYVLVPTLAFRFGVERIVIPAAALMLAYAVFIAILFRRAYRRLYPDSPSEYLPDFVKMILCPPLAIRAADLLTLRALSGFHPLLLAVLLPGPDRSSWLRSSLYDLRRPLPPGVPASPAFEAASWYASLELSCAEGLLRACPEFLPDLLLAPPTPDGVSSLFCPRCHGQFSADPGGCPDCSGVDLLPFPVPVSPGASHECL